MKPGDLVSVLFDALMAGVVGLTRPMPLVLVTGMLCVLAYDMILKTGGPFGMLIAVVAVLMSVMGMNSLASMNVMRDALVEASLGALVTVPLLYALLPAATREVFVEVYEPAGGGHDDPRTLIQGGVLLLLAFWLYTILETSNLVLAIAAVFVLVFPTAERQFAEA